MWSSRICNAHSYYDSVIPGEDRKLIQLCDEVPASSDVSSDEDANDGKGEGVHKGAPAVYVSAACHSAGVLASLAVRMDSAAGWPPRGVEEVETAYSWQ